MRKNGVLMHIASLSTPYGIGTMGKEAAEFADFLERSGQHYWQILPVCPTSYGDSPYQSFSTFAGNPYLIDLDTLCREGLIREEDYKNENWGSDASRIDYGALYVHRYPVLRKASDAFLKNPPGDYEQFCRDNSWWLEDYALFMAVKNANQGASWWLWDEGIRRRDSKALEEAEETYRDDISFWKVTQYLFFRQWRQLKEGINSKNIEIIGDLPIYVSRDSVDVWAHPELFQLDENMMPRDVAGCPPDGFSATGQLWGNPLFDWEYHKKTGYEWWIRRIEYSCKVYDVLRIDHFRGFDSYFAIPYGSETAAPGVWKQGPGMDLFRQVEKKIGRQKIIVEDLGFLTDSVKQLLADSGFPGMKVLELAFDSRDTNGNVYLPHNFIPSCIAYAGTHDNDTICGWMTSADSADTEWAKSYMHLTEEEGYNWGMMRALWSSVAETTIVQAQDLLGLGSEARMNEPSTIGANWQWRSLPGVFDDKLSERLLNEMKLYERV